jgi:uncharacterized membrane protein YdbT with pleckstrin-like domain
MGTRESPGDLISALTNTIKNTIIRITMGIYHIDAPIHIENGLRMKGGFIRKYKSNKYASLNTLRIQNLQKKPNLINQIIDVQNVNII